MWNSENECLHFFFFTSTSQLSGSLVIESVYSNIIFILLYDKNTTNNIVPDIQWVLHIYYLFLLNKSGR